MGEGHGGGGVGCSYGGCGLSCSVCGESEGSDERLQTENKIISTLE